MRTLLPLLLALALLPAGLCLAGEAGAGALPDILGWQAEGPTEEFDPQTVFKAINGAAETYLAYGFESLRIRSYHRDGITATINVYDLGLPLNAFGVYGKERPSQGSAVAAGDQALAAPPRQCLMHQGRHYVLIAAGKGAFTAEHCTGLLNAVSAWLPKGTGQPPQLSLLTTRHRQAGSEGYTPKGCFGLGSLGRCLHAQYKDEAGREYTAFAVLPARADQTPAQIWEGLAEGWTDKTSAGQTLRLREIPYRGPAALMLTKRAVLGVVDLEDEAQTLAVIRSLAAD